MINIKIKIILIFLLPCMLLGQVKKKQAAIAELVTLPKGAQTITLKTLSTKRIERLVNHYKTYVKTRRTSELAQGVTKIGLISGIVYFLYYLTFEKEDHNKDMKVEAVKRIYNDVVVATVVVLLTGGVNNATNNISNAWSNETAKKCSKNLLRRFLFEIRQYKYLIESLKEETPFVWDHQLITTYNQIVSSLEHIIAWQSAHALESHKKIVYESINTFAQSLEKYKELLIETRENNWSKEYRKKITSYTHSFLYPWIELITPEITDD
ncbi:hypothetical protein JKY79_03475 [Candidatus Babeliales bacterium]|nr:hypothetical protein [Candidatus Babeliales bacterium]